MAKNVFIILGRWRYINYIFTLTFFNLWAVFCFLQKMKVMIQTKEQRKSSVLVQRNLQAPPTTTRAPPTSFGSPPSRLSQSPPSRKRCRGPGRPRDGPEPTGVRHNKTPQDNPETCNLPQQVHSETMRLFWTVRRKHFGALVYIHLQSQKLNKLKPTVRLDKHRPRSDASGTNMPFQSQLWNVNW